ncbi:AAA family ATPase [Halobacteriales archaeon QS_8_69_26]|nr:MAG: AAA family ATPase [Halobacteriales archaeon QS_8_69_26]
MADWTEKYRPKTLTEVRGNDKACEKLREWAETWDDHREAVVLHGSPGIGKTSAAHALAADMGWPVTEMNASDERGRDVIERVAGEASKSGTLENFGTEGGHRRLVILDEADSLHRHADRGGAAAMTEVVKEANQPIVLIANDYYDMSRGLRNACQDIEFRDVSARSIVPALRNICREEGIEFDEEALELIAERTSGDLRSAVNDLQAAAEGDRRLTVEDVETGERDRERGIFDFLESLLQDASARDAQQWSYEVDESPPDLIRWIDRNLPKEYAGGELAEAYDRLAAADRWLGRVYATQNYSYWRYAGDNMTAGVAAARSEPKGGWSRYAPPKWYSGGGTRDEVARKVAAVAGTSVAGARREILPFLKEMTHHCKPRELTVRMAARYDMDEKEVSYVTGSGESTNKVEGIVEEARRRREESAAEATQGAFDPGEEGDDQEEADDAGTDEGDTAADGPTEDGQTDLGSLGTGEDPGGSTGSADDGTDGDPVVGTDPDATGAAGETAGADRDGSQGTDEGSAGGDEEATESDDGTEEEPDDQQSGLGDFM